eukprot:TRINITY_DN72629_c0_g1_i1.p1 TRINITY_DN72629_c0_g1~~TRINITY_DN72629_c0_g1_i1.p1  ORF type:complete len:203 (+),score=52.61 TRINITY_DN72629_c0_g1_i1:40-609(+)
MAEHDVFDRAEDASDSVERQPVDDRKLRSLTKVQMVDEVNVGALAQLGADFFAAARARLLQPRGSVHQEGSELGELADTKARHQRLIERAKLRQEQHLAERKAVEHGRLEELESMRQAKLESQKRRHAKESAAFAKDAAEREQRLLQKRKLLMDTGSAGSGTRGESPKGSTLTGKRTRLSFGGHDDDVF